MTLASPLRSSRVQPFAARSFTRPIRSAVLGLALAMAAWTGSAPRLAAAEIPLHNATIADIQKAYQKGTLTAEKLTEIYLARIAKYDQQGPAINTVITLNMKAVEQAKQLDSERKAGKVRGPLHGIPIVLKDNFDTFDLPTTAGSQLLEGSIPPDDAYVVKKLRDAGCIILAKVNLHEWAGGGGSVSGAKDPEVLKKGRIPNGYSSLGQQTHNPHDLAHGPGGSSSGTGAAIAADFAQFGLGTDTGGSIRNPSSSNGIVGLKPTHGLLSRDGIVPLALTFDTGGPMGRSVYDIAVALGVMTGVDSADAATKKSEGKFQKDYTKFLKKGSVKGARIGVARDFMGKNAETDRIMEEALGTLKQLGAEIIDVKYPDYLLQAKSSLSAVIMQSEFKAQIADYLKTTKPEYPKTLDDLVARANDPKGNYRSKEKAFALKYSQSVALDLNDPVYLAAKNEGLAMVRATFDALFSKYRLDVIVYPTNPSPAGLIEAGSLASSAESATSFANQTGYPDLIVPAGMTKEGLPVTISFFGQAFSEPKLLGYGYDFEQAHPAMVLPKTTPALAGDVVTY